MSLGGLQQGAGVEAKAGFARHQGVAPEARVAGRVRNVEEILLQDGLPAERALQGGLAHAQPDLGLEELAPVGHEVHHRNGGLAKFGGGLRNLVEVLLPRRIQQAVMCQRAKACALAEAAAVGGAIGIRRGGRFHPIGFPARASGAEWAARPCHGYR